MITLGILQSICPGTKAAVLVAYVIPLNDVVEYYEMTSDPKRVAGFLSQVAHESAGFTAVRENLNYSADGLRKIFGKYFPTVTVANQYARQPEKIANKVYAGRMLNGPESSGDGYKFRGRGLIQLTGRQNYTAFADALGMTIEDTVTYMETPAGACASAGWYWDTNSLNDYCDNDDFVGLTKRINGGVIGIEDRHHKYEIAVKLLTT